METKGFNLYRTIQAVHFLVASNGPMHFMKVIKLIFFADRYHIRNFGRLVTSDRYLALKLGPVGSSTKNVVKEDSTFFDYLDPSDREYYESFLKLDGDSVCALENRDYDELSRSDVSALSFALNHFGKLKRFELAHLTHDYPEWKRYESQFQSGSVKVIDINELDFFADPNVANSKYIQLYLDGVDPFQENIEVAREIRDYLIETRKLHSDDIVKSATFNPA